MKTLLIKTSSGLERNSIGMGKSIYLKLLGMAMQFAVLVVYRFLLPADLFGFFVLCTSASLLTGALIRFGLNEVVAKSIAAAGNVRLDWRDLATAYWQIVINTGVFSVLVVVVYWRLLAAQGIDLSLASSFMPILAGLLGALNAMNSAVLKGLGFANLSILNEHIVRSLVLLLIASMAIFAGEMVADYESISLMILVSFVPPIFWSLAVVGLTGMKAGSKILLNVPMLSVRKNGWIAMYQVVGNARIQLAILVAGFLSSAATVGNLRLVLQVWQVLSVGRQAISVSKFRALVYGITQEAYESVQKILVKAVHSEFRWLALVALVSNVVFGVGAVFVDLPALSFAGGLWMMCVARAIICYFGPLGVFLIASNLQKEFCEVFAVWIFIFCISFFGIYNYLDITNFGLLALIQLFIGLELVFLGSQLAVLFKNTEYPRIRGFVK